MKKLRSILTWQDFWLFAGAYLTFVLIQLLRFSSQDLYLTLGGAEVVGSLISMVVSYFLIWFLVEYKRVIRISKANSILAALVLFLGILKSPSLFLSLGLLGIALVLFISLVLKKERIAYLFPSLAILSFPKLLMQTSSNLNDTALSIHAFDLSKTIFSDLIWPIILSICMALLVAGLIYKLPFEKVKQEWIQRASIAVFLLGGLYVLYLCVVAFYKVRTYSLGTYDIGIFSQMFERMRTDFSQITTLERDKALSHFGVHLSPIYYLMLPVYFLFPYVETLDILQNIIVFSAVIPLYLIIKKSKLPKLFYPLVLALFFLVPVFTTAGGYHLHENCFLPPLILWTYYAIQSQWSYRSLVFIILLLFVKEDAFIYVLALGLYFMTQKDSPLAPSFRKWLALISLILPLAYLTFAFYMIAKLGDGVMVSSRFGYLLLDGENGSLMMIKNIILNPVYVLGSLLTAKKVAYLFQVLFSLAFLPLAQRSFTSYFLMLPLLFINLLPNWPYQYHIGFQYSYGSFTLLFIMALLALEQLYVNKLLTKHSLFAILASSLLFSSGLLYHFTHKWNFDVGYYLSNQSKFEEIQSVLDSVPKEGAVLAAGPYTPALRKHQELYDIYYHNEKKLDTKIDYIVVPRRYKDDVNSASTEKVTLKEYEEAGYKESSLSSSEVLVLEKGK